MSWEALPSLCDTRDTSRHQRGDVYQVLAMVTMTIMIHDRYMIVTGIPLPAARKYFFYMGDQCIPLS